MNHSLKFAEIFFTYNSFSCFDTKSFGSAWQSRKGRSAATPRDAAVHQPRSAAPAPLSQAFISLGWDEEPGEALSQAGHPYGLL